MAGATTTNTWDPSPSSPSQNYTAVTYGQDYSYNVGPTNTIILTIASWVLFGIICCLSRCLARYIYPPPLLELPRTTNNETANDDKIERLEFVKINLPFRTIEVGDGAGTDEEIGVVPSDKQDKNTDRITRQNLHNTCNIRNIASHNADTSAPIPRRPTLEAEESLGRLPVCSICLSCYDKGDEVAWSTNTTCPHEYHRECIQNWLMSHEECPMCRNVFLTKPEVADEHSCEAEPQSAPAVVSQGEEDHVAHYQAQER